MIGRQNMKVVVIGWLLLLLLFVCLLVGFVSLQLSRFDDQSHCDKTDLSELRPES